MYHVGQRYFPKNYKRTSITEGLEAEGLVQSFLNQIKVNTNREISELEVKTFIIDIVQPFIYFVAGRHIPSSENITNEIKHLMAIKIALEYLRARIETEKTADSKELYELFLNHYGIEFEAKSNTYERDDSDSLDGSEVSNNDYQDSSESFTEPDGDSLNSKDLQLISAGIISDMHYFEIKPEENKYGWAKLCEFLYQKLGIVQNNVGLFEEDVCLLLKRTFDLALGRIDLMLSFLRMECDQFDVPTFLTENSAISLSGKNEKNELFFFMRERLINAITVCSLDLTKYLVLQRRINPNFIFDGNTALNYAKSRAEFELCAKFLENNGAVQIDIDETQQQILKRLFECCMSGEDFDETLIGESLSEVINLPDVYDSTALMTACYLGHLNVVTKLLSIENVRKSINATTECGLTALFFARYEESLSENANHPEYQHIVRLLQEHGGELLVEMASGSNTLHLSCEFGWLEVVEFLIDELTKQGKLEEYIDKPNRDGKTPLQLARKSENMDLKEIILKHGLGTNTRAFNEVTLDNFYYCCLKANPHLLQQFLNDEKIVKMVDKPVAAYGGKTPLMFACKSGNKSAVDYILNCNVNIDKRCENGYSAFFYACASGSVEVVRSFLTDETIKEKINLKEKVNSLSALRIACIYGFKDIFDVLVEHGADPGAEISSLLSSASKGDSKEIFAFLLNSKAVNELPVSSIVNVIVNSWLNINIEIAKLGVRLFQANQEKSSVEAVRNGFDIQEFSVLQDSINGFVKSLTYHCKKQKSDNHKNFLMENLKLLVNENIVDRAHILEGIIKSEAEQKTSEVSVELLRANSADDWSSQQRKAMVDQRILCEVLYSNESSVKSDDLFSRYHDVLSVDERGAAVLYAASTLIVFRLNIKYNDFSDEEQKDFLIPGLYHLDLKGKELIPWVEKQIDFLSSLKGFKEVVAKMREIYENNQKLYCSKKLNLSNDDLRAVSDELSSLLFVSRVSYVLQCFKLSTDLNTHLLSLLYPGVDRNDLLKISQSTKKIYDNRMKANQDIFENPLKPEESLKYDNNKAKIVASNKQPEEIDVSSNTTSPVMLKQFESNREKIQNTSRSIGERELPGQDEVLAEEGSKHNLEKNKTFF